MHVIMLLLVVLRSEPPSSTPLLVMADSPCACLLCTVMMVQPPALAASLRLRPLLPALLALPLVSILRRIRLDESDVVLLQSTSTRRQVVRWSPSPRFNVRCLWANRRPNSSVVVCIWQVVGGTWRARRSC